MQIGKKGYPYPVLNNAKNFNCYKNETYSLELEEIEDGNNYILKNTRIETNSNLLKGLLNKLKSKVISDFQVLGMCAMSFMHGAQDGQKFIVEKLKPW